MKKRIVAACIIIFCILTPTAVALGFVMGNPGAASSGGAGSAAAGLKLVYGVRIGITKAAVDTGIKSDTSNDDRVVLLKNYVKENYVTNEGFTFYYQGFDGGSGDFTKAHVIPGISRDSDETKKDSSIAGVSSQGLDYYFLKKDTFKNAELNITNPYYNYVKDDIYTLKINTWEDVAKIIKDSHITQATCISSVSQLLSSGTEISSTLRNWMVSGTSSTFQQSGFGYLTALMTLYTASGKREDYKAAIEDFLLEDDDNALAKYPTLICVESVVCVYDGSHTYWVTVPQAFTQMMGGIDMRNFTKYSKWVGLTKPAGGSIWQMISNIHDNVYSNGTVSARKKAACDDYGKDSFWNIVTKRMYSKYFNCDNATSSKWTAYTGSYYGQYAMTVNAASSMYGYIIAGSRQRFNDDPPKGIVSWDLDPKGDVLVKEEMLETAGKLSKQKSIVKNINIYQSEASSKKEWVAWIAACKKASKPLSIQFNIKRLDNKSVKSGITFTAIDKGVLAPTLTTHIRDVEKVSAPKISKEFTVGAKVAITYDQATALFTTTKGESLSYIEYISGTINETTPIGVGYILSATVYAGTDEPITLPNKQINHVRYNYKSIPPAEDPAIPEEYIYESTTGTPFSELKAGYLTDAGANEPYEAMSGFPTTQNLFYASGGKEFVVQLKYEYVAGANATRNYAQPTSTSQTSLYIAREERLGNQNNAAPGTKPAVLKATCGKCGEIKTTDWYSVATAETQWNWAASASVPSHMTKAAVPSSGTPGQPGYSAGSPAVYCGGASASTSTSDAAAPGAPAVARCSCGITATVAQTKTSATRWNWKWVNDGYTNTVSHRISWNQSVNDFNYAKIVDCKVWQLTKSKLDGLYSLTETNELVGTIQPTEDSYLFNKATANTAAAGRLWHSQHPAEQDNYTFTTYNPTGTCEKCVTYYAGVDLRNKSPQSIYNDTFSISDYLILRTSAGDLSLLYFQYNAKNTSIPVGTVTVSGAANGGSYSIVSNPVTFTAQNANATEAKICKAPSTFKGIELQPDAITFGGYNGVYSSPSIKYQSTKGFNENITITSLKINENTYSKYKATVKPSIIFKLANSIDVPDQTISNGEYEVGDSYVFYKNLINVGTLLDPVADIVTNTRFSDVGFELLATYSPKHSKINNVVVHNPTTSQYATFLPLPASLDQRTTEQLIVEPDNDDEDKCSRIAATCPYSRLDCKWGASTAHIHTAACSFTSAQIQHHTSNGGYVLVNGVATYGTNPGSPERLYSGTTTISLKSALQADRANVPVTINLSSGYTTNVQSYNNFHILIDGVYKTVNAAVAEGSVSGASVAYLYPGGTYPQHPYPANLLSGASTGTGNWGGLICTFTLKAGHTITGVKIDCSTTTGPGDGIWVYGTGKNYTCGDLPLNAGGELYHDDSCYVLTESTYTKETVTSPTLLYTYKDFSPTNNFNISDGDSASVTTFTGNAIVNTGNLQSMEFYLPVSVDNVDALSTIKVVMASTNPTSSGIYYNGITSPAHGEAAANGDGTYTLTYDVSDWTGSLTKIGFDTVSSLNPTETTRIYSIALYGYGSVASLPVSTFTSTDFNYTGDYQFYTVPETGTYKLEAWGAQGQTQSAYQGGYGGYTAGETYLTQGSVLSIAAGQSRAPGAAIYGTYAAFGANLGGITSRPRGDDTLTYSLAAGGGASSVSHYQQTVYSSIAAPVHLGSSQTSVYPANFSVPIASNPYMEVKLRNNCGVSFLHLSVEVYKSGTRTGVSAQIPISTNSDWQTLKIYPQNYGNIVSAWTAAEKWTMGGLYIDIPIRSIDIEYMRICSDNHANKIIVSGGGGGSMLFHCAAMAGIEDGVRVNYPERNGGIAGGSGGGLIGGNGLVTSTNITAATGGTQSAAGYNAAYTGTPYNSSGYGGGGGYFPGGGHLAYGSYYLLRENAWFGSAAGGSSYVGSLTQTTLQQGVRAGHGMVRISKGVTAPLKLTYVAPTRNFTTQTITKRTLSCNEVHHSMSTNWHRYTEGWVHDGGARCTGIGCSKCAANICFTSPAGTYWEPVWMTANGYLVRSGGNYYLTSGTDSYIDSVKQYMPFDTYDTGSGLKTAIWRVTQTDAPSINAKTATSLSYHYNFGEDTCWTACNNDANHVSSRGVTVGGVNYPTSGDFVVLDRGFQIYFPNYGDFYGNGAYGISTTSLTTGKGYTTPMTTTTWLKAKYIIFGFDVIYDKNGDGNFSDDKLYKAGDPVMLGTFNYQGANATNNFDDYSNGTYLYNFYSPLENSEAYNSSINFYTVALNSAGDYYQANPSTTNFERNQYTKAAYADSTKSINVDLIGRIGGLTMVDTGDFRFANLFKSTTTGWLIDNLVKNVNPNVQNYYLADPVNIRGETASASTNGLNTYNTQPYKQDISKLLRFPLTPKSNNIQALQKQPQRIGYNNYLSLETAGNYYSENEENTNNFKVQVTPYYYHLDLQTGIWTPVDVYALANQGYRRVNQFNNPLPTSDYEWFYNLNWTEEQDRRNYSTAEKTATDSVVEYYTRYKTVDDSPVSVKILIPSGREYTFGTLQRLFLKDKNRSFIGSSLTNGINTNPNNVINEAKYARQAQRYHFTLGLPSSAVFIESGKSFNTANVDMLSNDHSVIVCAIDAYAKGEIWTLKYTGVPTVEQAIQILSTGNIYNYAGNPKGPGDKRIISVYSVNKSSKEDLNIEGTH